jgi:hypothetical protein
MQSILYKIYFWKVFHIHYKLICILYALLCGQNFILVKSGCYKACGLKYGKSWDKSLPYAEFSYNNSYQANIKMAPYEALYGRQCRTPLFWSQTGESQVFRPEVLKDAEKQVQIVRESLKVAQT